MLELTHWVGIVSVPILLTSAGCIMTPSYGRTPQNPAPEKMMAMAEAFERQGHPQQAKFAYQQVLAVRPDYPNARKSLETLVAKEAGHVPSIGENPSEYSNQLAGQQPPAWFNSASASAVVQLPDVLEPTNANNVSQPGDHALPVTLPQPGSQSDKTRSLNESESIPEQPSAPQASATSNYTSYTRVMTTSLVEITPPERPIAPPTWAVALPLAIRATVVCPIPAVSDPMPPKTVQTPGSLPQISDEQEREPEKTGVVFVEPYIPEVTDCSWYQEVPALVMESPAP